MLGWGKAAQFFVCVRKKQRFFFLEEKKRNKKYCAHQIVNSDVVDVTCANQEFGLIIDVVVGKVGSLCVCMTATQKRAMSIIIQKVGKNE